MFFRWFDFKSSSSSSKNNNEIKSKTIGNIFLKDGINRMYECQSGRLYISIIEKKLFTRPKQSCLKSMNMLFQAFLRSNMRHTKTSLE